MTNHRDGQADKTLNGDSEDRELPSAGGDTGEPHKTSKEAGDDTVDVKAPATEKSDVNPPRTTTGGWFTAPKFGSAGGGGGEIEPGPERD